MLCLTLLIRQTDISKVQYVRSLAENIQDFAKIIQTMGNFDIMLPVLC